MYNRKTKEDRPVLAVCYDFDKTLSPDDMQAQGYIQKVYDGDVASFWADCNKLSAEADMDSNLAYMYKMKQVNSNGGHSIGVYNSKTCDKTKVRRMMQERRVRYFAPADYTEGSEIDRLLKAIIIRTAANELLEEIYYTCKNDRE